LYLGLGDHAPGWFLVEPRGADVAWLVALYGAPLAKGSPIASGWTKTLRNIVIVGGDRRRALAIGEAESDLHVAWLPVPDALNP
jgi:hypothetical protein